MKCYLLVAKSRVLIAIFTEYLPIWLKYSRKNAEKRICTCYFAIFTVNLWRIMSADHRKQCNIVNYFTGSGNRTHL